MTSLQTAYEPPFQEKGKILWQTNFFSCFVGYLLMNPPFRKREKSCGKLTSFVVLWSTWLERNKTIFREVERLNEEVWEVTRSSTACFWALVANSFYLFFVIMTLISFVWIKVLLCNLFWAPFAWPFFNYFLLLLYSFNILNKSSIFYSRERPFKKKAESGKYHSTGLVLLLLLLS